MSYTQNHNNGKKEIVKKTIINYIDTWVGDKDEVIPPPQLQFSGDAEEFYQFRKNIENLETQLENEKRSLEENIKADIEKTDFEKLEKNKQEYIKIQDNIQEINNKLASEKHKLKENIKILDKNKLKDPKTAKLKLEIDTEKLKFDLRIGLKAKDLFDFCWAFNRNNFIDLCRTLFPTFDKKHTSWFRKGFQYNNVTNEEITQLFHKFVPLDTNIYDADIYDVGILHDDINKAQVVQDDGGISAEIYFTRVKNLLVLQTKIKEYISLLYGNEPNNIKLNIKLEEITKRIADIAKNFFSQKVRVFLPQINSKLSVQDEQLNLQLKSISQDIYMIEEEYQDVIDSTDNLAQVSKFDFIGQNKATDENEMKELSKDEKTKKSGKKKQKKNRKKEQLRLADKFNAKSVETVAKQYDQDLEYDPNNKYVLEREARKKAWQLKQNTKKSELAIKNDKENAKQQKSYYDAKRKQIAENITTLKEVHGIDVNDNLLQALNNSLSKYQQIISEKTFRECEDAFDDEGKTIETNLKADLGELKKQFEDIQSAYKNLCGKIVDPMLKNTRFQINKNQQYYAKKISVAENFVVNKLKSSKAELSTNTKDISSKAETKLGNTLKKVTEIAKKIEQQVKDDKKNFDKQFDVNSTLNMDSNVTPEMVKENDPIRKMQVKVTRQVLQETTKKCTQLSNDIEKVKETELSKKDELTSKANNKRLELQKDLSTLSLKCKENSSKFDNQQKEYRSLSIDSNKFAQVHQDLNQCCQEIEKTDKEAEAIETEVEAIADKANNFVEKTIKPEMETIERSSTQALTKIQSDVDGILIEKDISDRLQAFAKAQLDNLVDKFASVDKDGAVSLAKLDALDQKNNYDKCGGYKVIVMACLEKIEKMLLSSALVSKREQQDQIAKMFMAQIASHETLQIVLGATRYRKTDHLNPLQFLTVYFSKDKKDQRTYQKGYVNKQKDGKFEKLLKAQGKSELEIDDFVITKNQDRLNTRVKSCWYDSIFSMFSHRRMSKQDKVDRIADDLLKDPNQDQHVQTIVIT